MRRIVERHRHRSVVVSHKGTNRLVISSLLGFDVRGYRERLDQSPAALSILDFLNEVRPRLRPFNDVSHYEGISERVLPEQLSLEAALKGHMRPHRRRSAARLRSIAATIVQRPALRLVGDVDQVPSVHPQQLRRVGGSSPILCPGPELRRVRACVIALALLLASSRGIAADSIKIGGSGTALGTMRLLVREFTARHPNTDVTVLPSLGSGGGVQAVVSGAIDIAVTSRPMTESEHRLGAVETEYARTPFVFAVSSNSQITGISSGELADIYVGKLRTWADGSPVRIVLRPSGDSDTQMVKNISPEIQQGLAAAQARPGVRIAMTDQDAADDLEKIPGAVGPISLAVIASEKRALRALELDGTEPTPTNTATGAYPYYKRLFLVTGAERSAAAERFLVFVRSAAGQKIIASSGQWIP
jgi:phosphate transport system substrate-binding protein